MYRLIACDIDGTIVGSAGTLPAANRDALRRLHDRGVVVVIASGRATVSVRAIAERIYPVTDDTYLLSFNGARVVSAGPAAGGGVVVYERVLDGKTVFRVADYAREHGLLLHGYDESAFLAEELGEPTDESSRQYGRDVGMERIVVPNLGEALSGGSPKLLMIADRELLLRHRPVIQEIGQGRLATTFSKPHYLEVLHPEANKGNGLRHLVEHLGIPIEETIAVGDAPNDAEMLRAAGLGIAVANAHDELKECADVVLERSVDHGAIEEIEERFFP